jgi:hypothetical protein
MRKSHKSFVRATAGKNPLGRPLVRWKDSINTDLEK